LILLMDGSTAYEFLDGMIVELPGSHFAVIPPNRPHRGLHDIRRPATLMGIMFDLNGPDASRHSPFSSTDSHWMSGQFESGALQSRRMNNELIKSIKHLPHDFSAIDRSDAFTTVSLRLAICSILLDVAKQMDSAPFVEPKYLVQAAIRFMESHLAETISVEHIAKEVGCSRARLFELFKESVGMTPNDYWVRLRINLAQKLLKKTNKSILEIAMDCGFSTSQYFSNVFRKYTGVSPSDYRRTPSQ
ncbi:MAG: AraC family transcriptional regulator, partial [Pirellula sp.]